MCGETSSVGADESISHPSPVAYPPYIPPPKRPHPPTIYIRDATLIDGSENCRRFRASVCVRDGIIASVERTNPSEHGSTRVVSKEENGIRRSDVGGAEGPTAVLGTAPEEADSVLEIDGSDLILCSGFIDMHAHDLHLLSHPSHIPKVSQGITLEVVGQDGIGYSPLVGVEPKGSDDLGVGKRGLSGEKALEYVWKQITGWNGNPQDAPAHWEAYRHTVSGSTAVPTVDLPNFDTVQGWKSPSQPFFTWLSTAEYLNTLDAHHLAVNVAVLVPQGNLRLLVLGPDPPLTSASTTSSTNPSDSNSASQEEISQMRAILRKGLDEGAVGMSSGLTYVPDMYADYGELNALCEELALARSPSSPGVDAYAPYYAPHHRSYGLNALGAYEEMLRLGADTGAPIHLTHATINFPPNSGKADELLSMIAAYESRGVDVSLDTYPYTAGSTTLAALLPSWAAGGEVEAVITRLRGKGERITALRDGKKVTLRGEGLLEAIREDVCVRGSDGCNGLTMDWDTIEIAGLGTESAKRDPILAGMVGQTLGENARSLCNPTSPAPPTDMIEARPQDLTDPFHLFLHILISDSLSTTIIQHVGHEDNVRKMMRHRNHMFGTDAILAPTKCHPRGGEVPGVISDGMREISGGSTMGKGKSGWARMGESNQLFPGASQLRRYRSRNHHAGAHPTPGSNLATERIFYSPVYVISLGMHLTLPCSDVGGPGASGLELLGDLGTKLQAQIGSGWDVLSRYPRGVGRSGPNITLFDTYKEFWDQHQGAGKFEAHGNLTQGSDADFFRAQATAFDGILQHFDAKYVGRSGDNLKYVGSCAAVRDLVGMVDAIYGPGEDVNFYGFSYGTLIGAYLTQMFPDRIGKVILDGVLDAYSYTNGLPMAGLPTDVQDIESGLRGWSSAHAGSTKCILSTLGNGTADGVMHIIDGVLNTAHATYDGTVWSQMGLLVNGTIPSDIHAWLALRSTARGFIVMYRYFIIRDLDRHLRVRG